MRWRGGEGKLNDDDSLLIRHTVPTNTRSQDWTGKVTVGDYLNETYDGVLLFKVDQLKVTSTSQDQLQDSYVRMEDVASMSVSVSGV